jgi:signal transduction histidine kinase
MSIPPLPAEGTAVEEGLAQESLVQGSLALPASAVPPLPGQSAGADASGAAALKAVVDALRDRRHVRGVLQTLLLEVRRLLRAREAYILLLEGERLVVRYAVGGVPAGVAVGLDDSIEGLALTEGRPWAVCPAEEEPRCRDIFGRENPPGSLAAMPMRVYGRAIGVLAATRQESEPFTATDMWWLDLLAGLAGAAIEQDRAYRVQTRRARQGEVLLRLLDLAAEAEPEHVLQRLPHVLTRALAADETGLLLYDPARKALVVPTTGGRPGSHRDAAAGTGEATLQVPTEQDNPLARAYRTGHPENLHDVATDPTAQELFGARGLRSLLVVSLPVGDERRGVLYAATRAPDGFGREDLAFLLLIAARAGMLIERSELRARRAELERQQADTRAREEFIGIVSHELKTPVAVMQAYLEVLLRRAEREGRTSEIDLLQRVADQAERMLEMVEQLLDVQRIQAGLLPLELGRFDLAALARGVAEELQLTTNQHHIEVLAPQPVVVVADRRRLIQVLTNLLNNAIQYSPGGGRIEVRVQRDDAAGQAIVAVEDRGVGIPREQRERIFERFFRLSRGLHRGHFGLGVGLFIARELVRRHNGDMWVESEEGRGSTFYFRLPLEGPPDQNHTP